MLAALGLSRTVSLTGSFTLVDNTGTTTSEQSIQIGKLNCGGLDTVPAKDSQVKVLAAAQQGESVRTVCTVRTDNGLLGWCRGIDCSRKPDDSNDPEKVDTTDRADFPVAVMMRWMLALTGYGVAFRKAAPDVKEPVLTVHRSHQALWYSGCCFDTRVEIGLKDPLGAPLFIGHEPILRDGSAWYHLPRAWQMECRVFVRQNDSTRVSCKEATPVRIDVKRRLEIQGLEKADVYVLPLSAPGDTFFLLNSVYPLYVSESLQAEVIESAYGPVWKLSNVTGTLMVMDRA